MIKKWKLLVIPVAAAAVLAATAGTALAKGHDTNPPAAAKTAGEHGKGKADKAKHVVKGVVAGVANNVISLQDGQKVYVDDNTKYTKGDEESASLTDVVAGVSIVAQVKEAEGSLLAVRVHIVKVDAAQTIEGSVTAIASDSLTIKPASGDPIVVKTDANTVFSIKGKYAVAVGDSVTVKATKQADGSLLAKVVLDGVPAKESGKDSDEKGPAAKSSKATANQTAAGKSGNQHGRSQGDD